MSTLFQKFRNIFTKQLDPPEPTSLPAETHTVAVTSSSEAAIQTSTNTAIEDWISKETEWLLHSFPSLEKASIRFVSPDFDSIEAGRLVVSEAADHTFVVTEHRRIEYLAGKEKVSETNLGQEGPPSIFPTLEEAKAFTEQYLIDQDKAEEAAWMAQCQQDDCYDPDEDDEEEEDEEEQESYEQEAPSESVIAAGGLILGALTAKLNGLATEIRTQWAQALSAQPQAQDQINADYRGRISVYNEVAYALYNLNSQGQIGWTAVRLPEILHPETIEKAAAGVARVRLNGQRAIEFPDRLHERLTDFRELLNSNEVEIRGEWQADYENGMLNRHDVDTYFAGQVDHHNSMIDKVVLAHPELPTAAIQRIDYEVTRAEVRQHITAKQAQEATKITPNSYSIGMEI